MTVDLHPLNPISGEQKLLALLQKISLSVAEADSAETAFAEVLAAVCLYMRWPLGHVYVWSEAAGALVSSRIWYMDEESTKLPFRKLSERTQFRPGEGTLGLVFESGQAVTILDVQESTRFKRHLPRKESGIRAYFAFPVMVEEEVAAVLEFFSPEAGPPDSDMTSVIHHAGALLGLAMKQERIITRLRQSEAQLAESQRIAHVAHWLWDIKKDRIQWSEELFRIFGLQRTDFDSTISDVLQYIHPDDLAYVEKKIEDAVVEARSFNFYHRIIRPDGSERVLNARARPVFDQAGRVIELYGTAQDMTEQKESELKLGRMVRQMSALIEIGQMIASTFDLEVIYERMLGSLRPILVADALILFILKDGILEIVAQDQGDMQELIGFQLPANSGFAGDVLRSGHCLRTDGDDCADHLAEQLNAFGDFEPQAVLACPVLGKDEAIGILMATHTDPQAFSEEDLRLLETAANWTAIAISNARQYQELQHRVHEKDIIVNISNALTGTLDLEEVLQLIAQNVHSVIPKSEWTAIHLLESTTGPSSQLALMASAGLEVETGGYIIELGKGVAGQVMATGQVIIVDDIQEDSRRLPVDLIIKARALLVAPVESRFRRHGTITAQCATPAAFSEEDGRLLRILGVQAGIAIENARLHREQRKARLVAEKRRERTRIMARKLVQTQEVERARIARELHDEAGQSLTSLQISLGLLRGQLPDDATEIDQRLQENVELVADTMNRLRRLSHNLRPPGIDTYGLDATLAGLCQDFALHTQIAIAYNGIETPKLASLSVLTLYRFAQEALTNAAKHAQAAEIQVTLRREDGTVSLCVADNGRGFVPPAFDENSTGSGAGLQGMLERLEMVDGELKIDSAPGRGSRLTATVPFIEEEA